MTGVTSNDSKDSREPLSFKGSFWKDLVAESVSLVTGITGFGILSIVVGAMSTVLLSWVDLVLFTYME